MQPKFKLFWVILLFKSLIVTTSFAQGQLIAYYPFNGNANDETGHGYNGTVVGATLSDDRFGKPNSAYSFDGLNDKIVIGKEPNFPAWDTYAVSLWFLNNGGGDQGQGYGQKILSKAQFYTDFHLSVYGKDFPGRLSWWSAQGGFNSVIAANQDYRDNKWHHVVLNKKSPNRGDIWVDGVLQASSDSLEAIFNNEDLVIGYTTHTDFFQQKHWSGKIDDIRIYKGCLSTSEILALYSSSCTPFKVQIPEVQVLPKGVQPNTVYHGYAPADSLTLTAQVISADANTTYTYLWCDGQTTKCIKVSPKADKHYSVVVTSIGGCTAAAGIEVKVVDVRCGNRGDKVVVCKAQGSKEHSLCIGAPAVAAQLRSGATLGACSSGEGIVEEEGLNLSAGPNPSRNGFTLQLSSSEESKVTLLITDGMGRVVETKVAAANASVQLGGAYRPGIYYVEAVQGSEKTRIKLIKQAQ